MSIAFFASNDLPLPAIVTALRHEGVDVLLFVLDSSLRRADIQGPLTQAVLITNESGLVNIGEQVERVRELIENEVPLIVCAPQTAFDDREVIRACGASEIVAPESWSPRHVSERILSQIFLDGEVRSSRKDTITGRSIKVRELYSHLERLAPLSEPILVLGETGTGKELVARELHRLSGRPDKYVPVNCPELHPDLISSELFGHERGAFTGADKARIGLIASADKGTVFLDEIGDLDLPSQAKLLRVLEDRKVRKVGANHFEDVRARVIFATNRDLQVACSEGRFRQDLFERIRSFTVELPPLRERKSDIPLLVNRFVVEYNEEYGTNWKIPPGGIDFLFQYDWPGNIRELRGVIKRAAAYSDASGYISSLVLQECVRRPQTHLREKVVPFEPTVDTWREVIARAHRIYFRALLIHTDGNRDAAIKLSGLSKSQFFEKIKEIKNNK